MTSLLAFRQMLMDIRNDPSMRWPERRNGSMGYGPLTIAARRILLEEVRRIERLEGISILDKAELAYIADQWNGDLVNELCFN